MNLSSFLPDMNIKNYGGRYSEPLDIKDFKAIFHLPYAWLTLAFFENTALEIPYFVPSQSFFDKLLNSENYFFT